MNTPIPSADLDGSLPSAITPSMLDGYLAAVASGPTLVMPDRVLFWVSETAAATTSPGATIAMSEQAINDLVIRHYQAVNDALNDQTYAPYLADPQAWCRGYMAGVVGDMMTWAPLMAAQPELLKVIMSEGGDLAEAARRIHAFWVAQRLDSVDLAGLLGQLTALAPEHTGGSNQPLQ